MDTLAVVCDDVVECAEERDEKLCKNGTDRCKPLIYSLTAGAGMFYVILKLYWFFYHQHQPVGDEDDDDDMEMEEMEDTE